MQRRKFFNAMAGQGACLAGALAGLPGHGWAQLRSGRAASLADRVLILVELKGGNDGLNTVIPYADPTYYQLRETIAVRRETGIKLDADTALHPALAELLPLWDTGELAIVQGVGYPLPNLSHFRSIEIWDTASNAHEYLSDGWVARAMHTGYAQRAAFATEGVVIGGADAAVLNGARAVRLNNPEAFANQAQAVAAPVVRGNLALQHLLRTEANLGAAAHALRSEMFGFATPFPAGAFGNAVRSAAQVVASQRGKAGVPVIVLSLGSFDTHQNQPETHANLLRQLGAGLAALKGALTELAAWDRTLVMTFSEFGRRPRQNGSNGTDHGTAAPHFVTGGAVKGGLYGRAPDLQRLDSSQNLHHTTDFRQLYATIAVDWWGVDASRVVRGSYDSLNFIRG